MQEVYVRGVLYDPAGEAVGPAAALVVTAVLFGLMHVLLYGWSAFPLDAAAGLWLGWLRLATGGLAATATAHVLADATGWWVR